MIIKLSLIAFCAVFSVLQAKSQNIDSLKTLLQGKTGLEREALLRQLSFSYIGTDNALALQYGREV